MGIFNTLVTAVSDASDNAHGLRLRNEFDDSIKRLAILHERDEAIRRFVSQRRIILQKMDDWSNDGKLSQANALRKIARESFDLSLVEGYSLWLTSVWLESGVRRSNDAQHVWHQLDQLAAQHDAIEESARLNTIKQSAIAGIKEDERRKQAERALRERKLAANTLMQEVEKECDLLRRTVSDHESTRTNANLRRAVRRIVEIGFKTNSSPDLRHVNWVQGPSKNIVACCVGFSIATAELTKSDPAFHIAFCANYLDNQGCVPSMRKYYTMRSIDAYYYTPDTAVGVLVRVARDTMDAYINGDRSAFETLKTEFDY